MCAQLTQKQVWTTILTMNCLTKILISILFQAAALREAQITEERIKIPQACTAHSFFRMSVAQISDAINASRKPGSSKGVSREAIKKFIGDKSTAARINNTLKNAVKAKTLIQVKGSYKVAPVAKKVKVV